MAVLGVRIIVAKTACASRTKSTVATITETATGTTGLKTRTEASAIGTAAPIASRRHIISTGKRRTESTAAIIIVRSIGTIAAGMRRTIT